jgi:hypothetical protein
MFTPSQYRDQASVYRQRAKTAANASEQCEFSELEHSFTVLADNKQWLIDHHYKTALAPATDIQGVAFAQESGTYPALPRRCADPSVEYPAQETTQGAPRQRWLLERTV